MSNLKFLGLELEPLDSKNTTEARRREPPIPRLKAANLAPPRDVSNLGSRRTKQYNCCARGHANMQIASTQGPGRCTIVNRREQEPGKFTVATNRGAESLCRKSPHSSLTPRLATSLPSQLLRHGHRRDVSGPPPRRSMLMRVPSRAATALLP